MPAVRQAESRLALPAVKFSMAGTRPKAWSAKKAAAAPLALGSMRPTTSPVAVALAMRRPSTREPRTRRS